MEAPTLEDNTGQSLRRVPDFQKEELRLRPKVFSPSPQLRFDPLCIGGETNLEVRVGGGRHPLTPSSCESFCIRSNVEWVVQICKGFAQVVVDGGVESAAPAAAAAAASGRFNYFFSREWRFKFFSFVVTQKEVSSLRCQIKEKSIQAKSFSCHNRFMKL